MKKAINIRTNKGEVKTLEGTVVTTQSELLSEIQSKTDIIILQGEMADKMEPKLRGRKLSHGLGTLGIIGGFFAWPLWIVAGAERIFDGGYRQLKKYELANFHDMLILVRKKLLLEYNAFVD